MPPSVSAAQSILFFAHLWRRAEVVTEVEFIDIRYSGRAARFLRGFKALYLGIPVSCITFGWVALAMVKIIQTVFGTSGVTALAVCLGLTVFYTTLSGLWGVVATDMLLFGVAMAGSITLSVVSVERAGGIGALVESSRQGGRGGGRQGLPVGLPAARAGPAAGLFRRPVRPVVGRLLPGGRAGRRRLGSSNAPPPANWCCAARR